MRVTFTTADPAATLTVTDTTATNPLPAVTSTGINVAAAAVAASLAIKTPAGTIVGVPVWVRVDGAGCQRRSRARLQQRQPGPEQRRSGRQRVHPCQCV